MGLKLHIRRWARQWLQAKEKADVYSAEKSLWRSPLGPAVWPLAVSCQTEGSGYCVLGLRWSAGGMLPPIM